MSGISAKVINFQQISSDQGLSQNTVYYIAQDSLGFLWFGTEDGLNRYDGYSITVFRPDINDPYSIPSVSILSLLTAHDGTLWIGTGDGAGLVEFDPVTEHFVNYISDPDDSTSIGGDVIHSLAEDQEGNIWIGRLNGLDYFIRKENRFVQVSESFKKGQGRFDIISLNIDPDGSVWAGSNNGLYHIYPGSDSVRIYHHESDNPEVEGILSICPDKYDRLWVGTSTGLDVFDKHKDSFLHNPNILQGKRTKLDVEVNTLYLTQDSLLWVGTNEGIYQINTYTNSIEPINNQYVSTDGFEDQTIYAIFRGWVRCPLVWHRNTWN